MIILIVTTTISSSEKNNFMSLKCVYWDWKSYMHHSSYCSKRNQKQPICFECNMCQLKKLVGYSILQIIGTKWSLTKRYGKQAKQINATSWYFIPISGYVSKMLYRDWRKQNKIYSAMSTYYHNPQDVPILLF